MIKGKKDAFALQSCGQFSSVSPYEESHELFGQRGSSSLLSSILSLSVSFRKGFVPILASLSSLNPSPSMSFKINSSPPQTISSLQSASSQSTLQSLSLSEPSEQSASLP